MFYEESHKMAADICTKNFTDAGKWHDAIRLINMILEGSEDNLNSATLHFHKECFKVRREVWEKAAISEDASVVAAPALAEISTTPEEDVVGHERALRGSVSEDDATDGTASCGGADEQHAAPKLETERKTNSKWRIDNKDPSGRPS